jgi:hypothetical protein
VVQRVLDFTGSAATRAPRFIIKVTGAATLADAIVPNPDIDGSGCVDDADLLAVLFAFGNSGSGLDRGCQLRRHSRRRRPAGGAVQLR